MPTLPLAAERHYAYQQQVTAAVVRAAQLAWAKVSAADPAASWSLVSDGLVSLVTAAQVAAARDADPYLEAVLAAQGQQDDPAGAIQPAMFAGVAADGRPLASLLAIPAEAVSSAIAAGMSVDQAMASQGSRLEMLAETTVQDTGRAATAAGIAARPKVGGHVRMLVPPSCARCVILAGRWYRWSSDFQRHPRCCDCRMIPVGEDVAHDLTTDPAAYFRSLTEAQQNATFTHAGAEAVRLGADLNQVVNARRGGFGLTPAGARLTLEEQKILRNGLERGRLQKVSLYGQPVYITTEGVTRRGIAGTRLGAWNDGVKGRSRYRQSRTERLMPESILQIATDREDAIRLLKRYGFIL